MHYARPVSAMSPYALAKEHPHISVEDIQAIQLAAYEDGDDEFWLIVPTQEEWEAALTPDLAGEGDEDVSCAADREELDDDTHGHDAGGE